MAKFVCKYCGLGPATYAMKGPHVGEWCSFCKRWIRWVPKQEVNLENNTVEQEIVPNVRTIDDIKHERRLRYEEGLDDEVPF